MKEELDYQFWGEDEKDDEKIWNALISITFKSWLDPSEDVWDKIL